MTSTVSPPSAPTSPTAHPNPFVGPHALTEGDPLFGRSVELTMLRDQLIAERIVLLYSPSGGGKTSLLHAGLKPALADDGFAVRPTIRVTHEVPAVLAGRPVRNRYTLSTLLSLEAEHGSRLDPAELAAMRLDDYLTRTGPAGDDTGEECLFFDQFEELFTGDPIDVEDKEAFLVEVGEALRDRGRWAVFSMREDFVAHLDPYLKLLPTRLRARFRLDLLAPEPACQAIQGTSRRAGVEFSDEAASLLVDDLRTVLVQRGDSVIEAKGPVVEPVQLQVVCQRLWASLDGAATVEPRHVRELGDVDHALRDFYDDVVRKVASDTVVTERVLRTWITDELITEQGYRAQVQHGPPDDREGRVLPALEDAHLVRADRRRTTVWYELAHDRLVDPITSSNARWLEEHLNDLQRGARLWNTARQNSRVLLVGPQLEAADAWAAQNPDELGDLEREFLVASHDENARVERERRSARRTRVLAIVGTVVSIVAVAGLIAAVVQWRRVNTERTRSEANRLVTEALVAQPSDPIEAARMVTRAWETAPTDQATDALRRVAPAALQVDRALSGHTDAVTSAEFSADGETVLTTSADGTAKLWDAGNGEVLHTLAGHAGAVRGGRFSPTDDELVATWGDDGTVRLWSVATGEELATIESSTSRVWDAVFSPTGEVIGVLGLAGDARLWEVPSGRPLHTLELGGAAATAIAFLNDFGAVATGDSSGTVRVWSTDAGTELAAPVTARPTPGDDFSYVTTLASSPDGTSVAIGNSFADILVWRWQEPPSDLGDGNPGYFYDSTVGYREIYNLQFSPDGRDIAFATEKAGFLWDIGSTINRPIRLDGHVDFAQDVSFSPDGEYVVSASRDGTALVFDRSSGVFIRRLNGHHGSVNTVSVAEDGRILTSSGDGTAFIWAAASTRVLRGHVDWVFDVALFPDGQRAATVSRDGSLRVWDLGEETELVRIDEPDLNSVAIHPDGRYVAAGSQTGEISVWELDGDEAEIVAMTTLSDPIADVAFDPSGELLAAGTGRGLVALWPWRGDEPVRSVQAHPEIAFVAWSPNDAVLASGGSDGAVRLWDATTLVQEAEFHGHEDQIWSVAFSPDGSRLVSASSDLTARIWDRDDPEDLTVLRGHLIRLAAADFDRSGERVVTGAADGTIAIWDASSGENLFIEQVHSDSVNAVAALDDSRILSVGDDNVLRVSTCQSCMDPEELAELLRRSLDDVPPAAARAEASDVGIVDVSPGTCLPEAAGGTSSRVEPTACDEPHAYEVFAVYDFPAPAGAAYPDDLVRRADDLCAGYFDEYVGEPAESSELVISSVVPQETSWVLSPPDRQVTCLFADPEGEATGSARDSEG